MELEEELTSVKAAVPTSSPQQKEIYQRALAKSANSPTIGKISNKTPFSKVSKPIKQHETSSASPKTHHKRLVTIIKKHVNRQIKIELSALERIVSDSIKDEGIIAENFFKIQPLDQFKSSLNIYRRIYEKCLENLGFSSEKEIKKGIKSAISRHKTDLRIFSTFSLKNLFDKPNEPKSIKPEPKTPAVVISKKKDDVYLKRFITYYKKFIGRYIKLDNETLFRIIADSLNTWEDNEGKSLKELSKMGYKEQFMESIKIFQTVFDLMKSDIWGLNRTEEIEKGLKSALAYMKTNERIYDKIEIKFSNGIDKNNGLDKRTSEKEEETIEIIDTQADYSSYQKTNINMFKKFILRNLKVDIDVLENTIGESLDIWQENENKNPYEFSKMHSREKFDESLKIYREIYKKLIQMGIYGSPEQIEKSIKTAISYHKTSERIYETIPISIS
jgi:ribosomal protein L31E